MASAGDIGLSGQEQLRENELIFGKARCFTYVNTYIGNDDLDTDRFFVKDMELMKVEWSISPGTRINSNIDLTRLWVKVVSKQGDPDMTDTSDFVRKEAYRHFYFGVPEGWMGLDVVKSKRKIQYNRVACLATEVL